MLAQFSGMTHRLPVKIESVKPDIGTDVSSEVENGKVLETGNPEGSPLPENYFHARDPVCPAFVRLLSDLPGCRPRPWRRLVKSRPLFCRVNTCGEGDCPAFVLPLSGVCPNFTSTHDDPKRAPRKGVS